MMKIFYFLEALLLFYQLCHLSLAIPIISLVIISLSLAIPAISLAKPALSLSVPVLSLAVPGIPCCPGDSGHSPPFGESPKLSTLPFKEPRRKKENSQGQLNTIKIKNVIFLDFRDISMFILQVPPTSLIHKMTTRPLQGNSL